MYRLNDSACFSKEEIVIISYDKVIIDIDDKFWLYISFVSKNDTGLQQFWRYDNDS